MTSAHELKTETPALFHFVLSGEYCPLSNLTTGPTEPNDQDQSHGGGWQEWLEAISQLRGGALKQTTALKQVPGPLGMLSASGAARFWPEGSGIFHDSGYNSICLVNLEDHCRLAVSVQGGNVTRALQDFAHLNEEVRFYHQTVTRGRPILQHAYTHHVTYSVEGDHGSMITRGHFPSIADP